MNASSGTGEPRAGRNFIELITIVRKNMKNKLSLPEDRYVYRARGVIGPVTHVLKDVRPRREVDVVCRLARASSKGVQGECIK